MTKKLKPAILLLLNLLLLQSISGQSQISVTDFLEQRFVRYCESIPWEEVYLHSDREEYISGENLWFTTYLIDRKSFKPSLNSKIIYFELLNPVNRPVVQKRIFVDKGFGPGHIVLPDTLTTGTYTIRAYTSWMKNFLPYNCFMKEIKIYNAFNTREFKEKPLIHSVQENSEVNLANKSLGDLGLAVDVNNFMPDNLEIYIKADENYRLSSNGLFSLFIQTHGKIDHVSSGKLIAENTKITIPRSLLTAGINQITLFDSKGIPVYERYVFTPFPARRIIDISSADSYATRSKVILGINPEDELSGLLKNASLSISVAPDTESSGFLSMEDFLIFGTEYGLLSNILRGRKISDIPPVSIDSILLFVNSNWIDWKAILSDKLPVIRYKPEKEDHYIFGKLLGRNQQSLSPGEFILMQSPGKNAVFQYARTDINGDFNFSVHIDDGLKDLLIQPADEPRNKTIKIESSFSDQYLKHGTSIDLTKKPVPSYISKWGINYQVQKIYGSFYLGDPLRKGIPMPTPKRFYGKPDIELVMADYIKLPVMQEVFFELIPGVFLRNRKSGYEISISDPITNKTYDKPPGLMVDGVIINNASIIANLDPELVEKIEVINERYFVGDYLFFGIVNIISNAGNFSSVTLPDYAIRLPYRVVDPVNSFVSPDYSSDETRNRRTPDFRTTLYWNPSILTDNGGKAVAWFWTSDNVSDYAINIQGITQEGTMISFRKTIKVR
jgi:hypothetical protein